MCFSPFRANTIPVSLSVRQAGAEDTSAGFLIVLIVRKIEMYPIWVFTQLEP